MSKIKAIMLCLILLWLPKMISNNLLPTFNDGMSCDNRYKPEFTNTTHWQKAEKNYESFLDNPNYQKAEKIPKIIHQIWIGSPFPARCIPLQKSWQAHHPDWEYKLWTDSDIKALKLTNHTMYNQASNYGEKSDIARYEILYRFGGLYVDTDFKCLQSFDYLHHTCTFYTGLLYPQKAEIFPLANGLIASTPGHPVLKECIETMHRNNNDNSPMAIIGRTGPHHLSACYKKLLMENRLPENSIALPTNFFYAFPAWERFEKNQTKINKWLKSYSLAIHYWHCSWQKKLKIKSYIPDYIDWIFG